MNRSGIFPAGHRVLIKPDDIPETAGSGVIVIPDNVQERYAMAQSTGTVVGVGKTAWAHEDFGNGVSWAEIGDRVAFAKYAGIVMRGEDKKSYRLINDSDVTAVISEKVSFDGVRDER